MKILIRLLLIIACPVVHSQNYIPYYNLTNEAEWHYDNNRNDSAKFYFEKAFQLDLTPKTKDIWIYGLILNKEGATNKVFRLLKNHMIEIGGADKPITPYLNKAGIQLNKKQKKKLDKLRLDTSSEFHKEHLNILAIIDSMYLKDTLSRKIASKANYQGVVYSPFHKQKMDAASLLNWADSSNAESFKFLFEAHHFIEHDVSGAKLSVIMIHLNSHFQELYDDFFNKLKHGTLDPYDFASIADRSSISRGECLKYLAYPWGIEDSNCISFSQIKENRRLIGLSTHYRRPSYLFHIPVGKMMKVPLQEYFELEFKRKN